MRDHALDQSLGPMFNLGVVLCAVSSSATLRAIAQCGWAKRDLAGGSITGKGEGIFCRADNGTHILHKLGLVQLAFELFESLVFDVTSKSVREFAFLK